MLERTLPPRSPARWPAHFVLRWGVKGIKVARDFPGGGEPHHPLLQTKSLGIPVAVCAEEGKAPGAYVTRQMPDSETRVPEPKAEPRLRPTPRTQGGLGQDAAAF